MNFNISVSEYNYVFEEVSNNGEILKEMELI